MYPTVRSVLSCFMALLGIATYATSSPSLAGVSTASPAPREAAASDNGTRDRCDAGFRKSEGICRPIAVPDHAYLADHGFGRGWQCHYGHRLENEACRPVVPPPNAYLTGYAGDQWACERTYVRQGDRCVATELPANAIAASRFSTSGWTCERGYHEKDGRCARIIVPVNAYLDSRALSGWECDRGYLASGDRCLPVVVPPNGYLSSAYGRPGFECERGFRASGLRCEAIAIPAHAHLDHSGNDWECDPPYRRQQDRCSWTPSVTTRLMTPEDPR